MRTILSRCQAAARAASIVALVAFAAPLHGQLGRSIATAPEPAVTAVTPLGETLRYDGFFGPLPVGGAEIAVAAVDTMFGDSSWVFTLRARGGAIGIGNIDYAMRSWVKQDGFTTRRFHTTATQGGAPYARRYLVRGDSLTWREEGSNLEYDAPTGALDELALLYLIRGITLAPGDSLVLQRYFKKGYNPVVVKARASETVTAGTGVAYPCRVYAITAIGATSLVWISDDAARIPVRAIVPLGAGPVTMRWTGR